MILFNVILSYKILFKSTQIYNISIYWLLPRYKADISLTNYPQQELALRQAGVHPVVAALYAQQILNNGDSKSVEAKQQELLLHALLAQQNDPKQQQMLLQSLLTQQNLVQQQAILQAILSQAEPKVCANHNAC